MKNKFILYPLIPSFFGLLSSATFGHDIPVHEAITFHAQESAYHISSSYSGFVNMVSNDLAFSDATNFIVKGSGFEDNKDIDEGGKRSLNHFYDPLDNTYGKGLSETFPDIRLLIGNNSFTWAWFLDCPGYDFPGAFSLGQNENTANNWSWQNARVYEWSGLSLPAPADRIKGLTNMFRAVGQVMHLLEDTTQPQHVRNEQHLDQFVTGINTPWRSPIEDYGNKHVANLNYQHSMLDWRGAGFTKLEDFWDRHMYGGYSEALNADLSGGVNTLGLAEWCNGNFLGARHLYSDYYAYGDIRYYPLPSRSASTDYAQKSANPISGAQTLTLRNGQQIQAIYLNKTGAGVQFPDHSRFDYFGAKFPHFGMVTINDDNVLASYHNVLIPKAVKYSAGLLDYFFRGQLGVKITPNNSGSNPTYQLTITNTSGQDFKGGTFHLFYDDDSGTGTRTELLSSGVNGSFQITWDSTSGSLADKATITANLTPPSSVNVARYTLVYRGTIGTTSGQPSDPVDQNIAIAATTFLPFSWWPMEELSGDRIDVILGDDITSATYDGGTISTVPGKIGNAVQLAVANADLTHSPSAEIWDTTFTPATQNGATLCGWWKYGGAFSELTDFSLTFNLGRGAMFNMYQIDGTSLLIESTSDNGPVYDSGTVPFPSSGDWHFFIIEIDSTGAQRLQFDNSGTVYSLNGQPPTGANSAWIDIYCDTFYDNNSGMSGNLTVDFDEVGLFPKILTQAQKDYLYNAGNGRTYPFSLP